MERGGPRRFTLLELAVVMLLLAMMMALVIPRVGRLPRRIAVRTLVSTVETAFRDAGLRARGSGEMVTVTAEPEGNRLEVKGGVPRADQQGGEGGGEGSAVSPVAPQSHYVFPKRTEWSMGEWEATATEDEVPVYRFLPNGEAEGPVMTLALRGSRFEIVVDALTGRPLVTELDE